MKETIMIVDDTPANLRLLDEMLRQSDYRVAAFPRGQMALAAAATRPPDLILLDINMPEMNGYEVCEKLKADPNLKEIPVIFISALSETSDKIRAFAAGGVDYVSKPFQFEEVNARVRAHLEIQRHQKALRDAYDRLREVERLKDSLVQMIVHDMRSPLQAIDGFLSLALEDQLAPITADSIVTALQSTNQLIQMVSSLLDISKMEEGAMKLNLTTCDFNAIMDRVLSDFSALNNRHVVNVGHRGAWPNVKADHDLLTRILQNLVGNALKHTPSGSHIQLDVTTADSMVRVSVRDNGAGIAPEYHKMIFEKFGQVGKQNGRKYSSGLGLAFCRLAVETHGGRIGVESEQGKGSTFWFELPA